MDRDPIQENGLPSDVGAEKAMLGGIVRENKLLAQAQSLLEKSDFFLDSHRRIFDAMVCLKRPSNSIDSVMFCRLGIERIRSNTPSARIGRRSELERRILFGEQVRARRQEA